MTCFNQSLFQLNYAMLKLERTEYNNKIGEH